MLHFLAAGALSGQESTGTIAGRVLDERGDALSRAVVGAVRSDSSVERRDVSGVAGSFRLGLLPPGSYTVTVRRIGYQPQVRSEVVVRAGATTELDLRVTPAVTTLGAVMIGAAPNEIERDDTRLGLRLDEVDLSSLPVGDDISSIVAFTPGARPDQVWGGATEQANNYVVDGMALNHPGVGGPLLALNPSWLTELEVTGLGAGAEFGGFQGGLIRSGTKSGSNTRAGFLRAIGESSQLNGSNLGITEATSELASRRSIEAELRGPIVRDRFFYYVSGQILASELRALNHIDESAPSGSFLAHRPERSEMKAFGKLTWQVGPRDLLDLSAAHISLTGDHAGATGFESADAGVRLVASTSLANISWRRTWGDNGTISLRAAHTRSEEARNPYAGIYSPGVLTWELGGDRAFHNSIFRHTTGSNTSGISGAAGITGTTGTVQHSWSSGFEVSSSRYRRAQRRNGSWTWRPAIDRRVFDPARPTTWRVSDVIPVSTGGEIRVDAEMGDGAIYLEDRIEFSPRVAVIAGVRHNWWAGKLNPRNPSALVESVRDFATEPRVGLILDPSGNNRTVAKVHWGRYHQHLFAQFFDRIQGGGVFTNEEFWYYTGPTPVNIRTTVTELDREALIASGRLFRVQQEILNEEGGVFDYRQPYMNQIMVSLEQSIGSRWKAEAIFINRQNKQLVALVDRNSAANHTVFENVRIVDRFTGAVFDHNGDQLVLERVYVPNNALVNAIQLWAATPGSQQVPNFRVSDIPRLTWDPDFVVTTAPGAKRVFDQLQLNLTGRFSSIAFAASMAFTRLEGNLHTVTGYDDVAGRGAGQFVRPNEGINSYGHLSNVSPLEGKLRVSGGLPGGIRGGVYFNILKGEHFTPTFTHSPLLYTLQINDPVAIGEDTATLAVPMLLPLVGHRVFLETRGSKRYPDRRTIDFHLERSVTVRSAELLVSLDGFNILGQDAITEVNTAVNALSDPNATGPYASSRRRMPPRTIRFGAAVRF